MSLEIVGGDSEARQVRLRALLPEGKLVFASKVLDLGGIPVGVPQTSVVILKNTGLHDAMFQVRQPHHVSGANCTETAPMRPSIQDDQDCEVYRV